jgi:hypothetical protein
MNRPAGVLERGKPFGVACALIVVACGQAYDQAFKPGTDPDAAAGAGGRIGAGGAGGTPTGGASGGGGSSGGVGGTSSGGSSGADASSGGSSGSDASSGGSSAGDAAPGDTSSGGSPPDGGPNCIACTSYGGVTSGGVIQTTAIRELSGIAASRSNPGVFYAHNDSGDSARFFAFVEGGRAIGEFALQGGVAVDWEDMDVGPCPSGTCVFLADIGDNSAVRSDVQLYRVAEPDVDAGESVGTVQVTFDRFSFRYANGSQNAEALVVHPVTGDVYIISKTAVGPSFVYRMPAPTTPGAVQTLPKIADLVLPNSADLLVTGAAVHPSCDRLLVRTYGALYEFRLAAPGAFDSIFSATPQPVPVASEGQGEAVSYLYDGRGYVSASEGASPELHVVRCL